MRDLRAEDFVILVGVFCCTIMMGIELVCSQIKTNQYNQACELQNSGYEVYMDEVFQNDEISTRRLDPDNYKIRIDEEKKEIIITH